MYLSSAIVETAKTNPGGLCDSCPIMRARKAGSQKVGPACDRYRWKDYTGWFGSIQQDFQRALDWIKAHPQEAAALQREAQGVQSTAFPPDPIGDLVAVDSD